LGLFELCNDHPVPRDHSPRVRARGLKAIDSWKSRVGLVKDPTDLGFKIQGSSDAAGEHAVWLARFEGGIATTQGILWSHAGHPDFQAW
jgi:hypothetical protein